MPDRTTIVMPPELKERALRRAREQKISFGEFVRRAVEHQLLAPRRGGRAKTGDSYLDNIVTFDDGGPTDMSTRVDDYLYEALEDELRRHGHFSGAPSPKGPVSRRVRPAVANARKAGAYKQSRGR